MTGVLRIPYSVLIGDVEPGGGGGDDDGDDNGGEVASAAAFAFGAVVLAVRSFVEGFSSDDFRDAVAFTVSRGVDAGRSKLVMQIPDHAVLCTNWVGHHWRHTLMSLSLCVCVCVCVFIVVVL